MNGEVVSPTCPFCLEEIEPEWKYCRRCDEPLTTEAEQNLAPRSMVERARDLHKAKAKATEALSAALISPFFCWILLAPLAIAYGFESRRIHAKHNEPAPASAMAAIVIGFIVLGLCGLLTFGNALLSEL